MTTLVRLGALPTGTAFVTPITRRPGVVLRRQFDAISAQGVLVALGAAPDADVREERSLHGDVLVEPLA